jgi:hypothetical protein
VVPQYYTTDSQLFCQGVLANKILKPRSLLLRPVTTAAHPLSNYAGCGKNKKIKMFLTALPPAKLALKNGI